MTAEVLRAQGEMSDQVEAIYSREAQSSTCEIVQQAEKNTQEDRVHDQEEEKEYGLAVWDGSLSNISSEGATSGNLHATTSEPGTDDMLERTSEKAISLSKLAVRQDFANVIMGDENEISQKAPAFAKGAAHQSIVHVEMGSKNKAHQG